VCTNACEIHHWLECAVCARSRRSCLHASPAQMRLTKLTDAMATNSARRGHVSSLQSLYRVHSPGQSFFSFCEQAPLLQQAPVHTPFGWHFPSLVHFAGAAQAVSSMPSLQVPSAGLQQAPRGMLSLFAQSAWPHFTPDDHAPAQSDSTPSEH
jgi:hypothetical protein